MTIYAATGHRPAKLGGYDQAVFGRLVRGATRYLQAKVPVHSVISGMALGWDTAWATAAFQLGIPLVAAIPFEGQEKMWPEAAQANYRHLLKHADRVVMVNRGGYHPGKMQARNCWMVENADVVVALWDGSTGGTANCVGYANLVGKPVENLWPHFKRWAPR